MARLGEKIKNAKKYGNMPKNWNSKTIKKDSSDKCPACQVKFKDMTARSFTKHMQAFDNGGGCPDA